MEEKILKIIKWTKIKINIHTKNSNNIYFYDREVWWINISSNIGFEQDGKSQNFSRPALIIKKFKKICFG
ncbi:MAG: hypothetical protein WC280_03610 [Patescibacteria group bacterium]